MASPNNKQGDVVPVGSNNFNSVFNIKYITLNFRVKINIDIIVIKLILSNLKNSNYIHVFVFNYINCLFVFFINCLKKSFFQLLS